MTCGIYLIENKQTGQKYIGQSKNIERRWSQHKKYDNFEHSYIDNAIKKYSANIFKLSILYECENDSDLLNELEKYYIWKYNTYQDKNHYNLTPGGDFNPMYVDDIRNKLVGKKKTKKHRLNISKAKKGKKLSKEHKQKLKENHADLSGNKNPMYGKIFSLEHRQKLSKAKNTTGFLNVSKQKHSGYKLGYRYAYQYYVQGTRYNIYAPTIKKLEQKVKNIGLPWVKFDDGV